MPNTNVLEKEMPIHLAKQPTNLNTILVQKLQVYTAADFYKELPEWCAYYILYNKDLSDRDKDLAIAKLAALMDLMEGIQDFETMLMNNLLKKG